MQRLYTQKSLKQFIVSLLADWKKNPEGESQRVGKYECSIVQKSFLEIFYINQNLLGFFELSIFSFSWLICKKVHQLY